MGLFNRLSQEFNRFLTGIGIVHEQNPDQNHSRGVLPNEVIEQNVAVYRIPTPRRALAMNPIGRERPPQYEVAMSQPMPMVPILQLPRLPHDQLLPHSLPLAVSRPLLEQPLPPHHGIAISRPVGQILPPLPRPSLDEISPHLSAADLSPLPNLPTLPPIHYMPLPQPLMPQPAASNQGLAGNQLANPQLAAANAGIAGNQLVNQQVGHPFSANPVNPPSQAANLLVPSSNPANPLVNPPEPVHLRRTNPSNPPEFTAEEIQKMNTRARKFLTELTIVQLGFNSIISSSVGSSGIVIDSCLGQTVLLFLAGIILLSYPRIAIIKYKVYFKNILAKVGLIYIFLSIFSIIVNLIPLCLGDYSRFSVEPPTAAACIPAPVPVPAVIRDPLLDTLSAIFCILVSAIPLVIRPLIALFDNLTQAEKDAQEEAEDRARIQAQNNEIYAGRERAIRDGERIDVLISDRDRAAREAERLRNENERLVGVIAHDLHPCRSAVLALAHAGNTCHHHHLSPRRPDPNAADPSSGCTGSASARQLQP